MQNSLKLKYPDFLLNILNFFYTKWIPINKKIIVYNSSFKLTFIGVIGLPIFYSL